MKKTKKLVLTFGLGAALALSVFQFAPADAAASQDGSCMPWTDWVCGLNGSNYNNKLYVSGGQKQ